MLNFFDDYERSARIYPAILLSIPIIITCYSFSALVNSPFFTKITSSSIIVLVGVVLLSNVVRFFGKKIEPIIWEKWGGAPSTRFLRKDDRTLAREMKDVFYQKVLQEAKIDLLNDLTDERIEQALKFVRNVLYNKDETGLWRKSNKEYGFARNLMGSRWVWVILSFGLAFTCWFSIRYFSSDTNNLIVGAILNACCGLGAILCGWCILPGLTKGIAERYAEQVIISYINLK